MPTHPALVLLALSSSAAVSLAAAPPPYGPARPVERAAGQVEETGEDRAGSWQWPLRPRPEVAAAFDAPSSRWGPGHRGLDLVGSNGAEVRAVADGVVSHRGRVAGRPTISVTHASGLRSTYEPVTSELRTGERVERGEVIGELVEGPDHCAEATCLHLGALRGRDYLDPFPLFGSPRVILLPTAP
ncbi:M23 family metallopeptidase [Marihabitans asiaticum]|uniref:M23 family metallopeptidase n=1 Tax=Marihabitans asiaticum TaxID=415218 RepID=UPI00119D73C5|nr:M23 family metallopeptidase [Marihabitans asiaticum]